MTLEWPADMVICRSRLNAKINRNFEVFTPSDFLAAITQHIPNTGAQPLGDDTSTQRDRRADAPGHVQGGERAPTPTDEAADDDGLSANASANTRRNEPCLGFPLFWCVQ